MPRSYRFPEVKDRRSPSTAGGYSAELSPKYACSVQSLRIPSHMKEELEDGGPRLDPCVLFLYLDYVFIVSTMLYTFVF